MHQLSVNDFEAEETEWGHIFSGILKNFWEQNVSLTINTDDADHEKAMQNLEKALPDIQTLLNGLARQKQELQNTLLENGYLNLANEWIEGAEKAEGKENCYLIDEDEVCLPLSREEFFQSMQFELSIELNQENKIDFTAVYVLFSPDYFAGHCIEAYLDTNGKIAVNGLAG